MVSFISINLFITSFQMTQGGVSWLYVAEVCVDAAVGFASNGQFLTLCLLSFSFEFLINSSLGVHGTLWIYGVVTLIGGIFVVCFVKETRGLSDQEKKSLYSSISSVNLDIKQIEMTSEGNKSEV